MSMHGILPLLVAAVGVLGPGPDGPEITLAAGRQRVVPVRGLERVAIGDPEVADVQLLPGRDQLLLTAVAEGRTSLLVWTRDGRRRSHLVRVTGRDLGEVADAVRAMLASVPGVRLDTAAGRLVLEGEVDDPEALERIRRISRLHPDLQDLVGLSGRGRARLAETARHALAEAGLPHVRVAVRAGTVLLTGRVDDEAGRRTAIALAGALAGRVEDLLEVDDRRLLSIEVRFLEVRRSADHAVGVRWPLDPLGEVTAAARLEGPLASASGGPTATVDAAAGVRSPVALNLTASDGVGRVLARPRLLCVSGGQARFLAGGEVPLPVVTADRVAIEYKPYGVRLEIRPRVARDGSIRAVLAAEVSEVDASVAVAVAGRDAVPGFRTRHLETEFVVPDGETVLVSGLLGEDQRKVVTRLPVLGRIPVLGELFKSRRFVGGETELVVAVTPRRVAPGDAASQEDLEGAERRFRAAGDEVDFSLMD